LFAYIVRRLVYGAITLFVLSALVFMLVQFGGGSPLDRLKLNPRMANVIQKLTVKYGLDLPLYQQYFKWLGGFISVDRFVVLGASAWIGFSSVVAATAGLFFARVKATWWRPLRAFGILVLWVSFFWFAKSRIDFAMAWGDSFRGDGPVWDLVFGAAGATFRLGATALMLALIIGLPLGVFQAVRQYSFFDQVGTLGSFIAFSTPIFIVATGLQVMLAFYLERWTGLKVFFTVGMTQVGYGELERLAQLGDIFRHLALPALSIALISIAGYARFQRASMLEVLHSDYLRTAKSKGLPRRTVLVKHALRNALLPIVTIVTLDVAGIIGGAIITESIFGWPGVGRLYIGAINAVDYPVIMAIVMVIGVGIVFMNIVADILYGVLDPRVRYE
jgi:peptide/nickel transport system permease protein